MDFCCLVNQFGYIFEELIKNTAIYWNMHHHKFTKVADVECLLPKLPLPTLSLLTSNL